MSIKQVIKAGRQYIQECIDAYGYEFGYDELDVNSLTDAAVISYIRRDFGTVQNFIREYDVA